MREPLRRRLPQILKGLGRIWVQFIAAVLVLTLLVGPVAPVMVAAALFTLGLPVLALTLWGLSLDEQIGLSRHEDEGPW